MEHENFMSGSHNLNSDFSRYSFELYHQGIYLVVCIAFYAMCK